MKTNILTKGLTIWTNCYKDDKNNYWPEEIRGYIKREDVIMECNDVKELERLKDYITKTMPK